MTIKKIPLGNSGMVAMVDHIDYARVSKHRWYLEPRPNGVFYAKGSIGGRWTRLHRFILRLKPGVGLVDHDDRDGLNNTRRNLIISDKRRNRRNSKKLTGRSRFKGIWKNLKMPKSPWNARLHIGCFRSEREAAAAYHRAFRLVFPGERLWDVDKGLRLTVTQKR